MSTLRGGFGRVASDVVKVSTYIQVTDQIVTDALQDAYIILFGIDPTGMTDEEMRQAIDERQREMFERAARAWFESTPPVTPDQLPSGHPLVRPAPQEPS